MNFRVIGLDPAEHCGWAVLDEQGIRLASGVWNMTPRRHEGGGMRFVRFRQYLVQLFDTFEEGHPHTLLVAYEEVASHKGTAAAQLYGGYVSHIGSLCEERDVPYCGIPVGTAKKVASGVGNCSKEVMVAAAKERWSHEPEDDNEADALWVAESLLVDLSFKKPWREET